MFIEDAIRGILFDGYGTYNIGFISSDRDRDETQKDADSAAELVQLWHDFCHEEGCLPDSVIYVEWCQSHGLEFDAVNENLPEMIKWYGNDCRKIAADVYIDDKAIFKAKYRVPFLGESDG